MKRLFIPIIALLICACQPSDKVVLENDLLRLTFDRATANLISMTDLKTGYEYIDSTTTPKTLWELVPLEKGHQFGLPTEVSISSWSKRKAILKWRQVDGEGIEVTATVSLDKKRALSYWDIALEGFEGDKLMEVNYPRISNIKEFTEEEIALSNWTGRLYKNIRAKRKVLEQRRQNRPTMQLAALYGEEPSGLYIASNDTESMAKGSYFEFEGNTTTYKMVYMLPMDEKNSSFKSSYQTILGAFQGNWYDAAQIYREWALQQEWAKKNRLHSGKMNPWLPETDIWMWNRGRSNNVLTEAEDLRQYLGDCNVSVLWHWWHNGPYDDAFPEYLPPREGRESFVKAVAEAKKSGINMTPYMNSIQWGESRESWKELNIEQYVARRSDGSTHAHVYNAFTGNAITPMCMSQEFWREKYSDLCDTVVNDYGCTGVYMDQACLYYRCYAKNHGHTVGGGNHWVKGYHKLVELIREKTAEANPILTGEGSGEDWMAHLDGFLTLEGSRERMSGLSSSSVIPLFNAVYHERAICFGNFGGFTYPPYDEFWPKEFRAPNTETLLPAIYNTQMRMEQARTFVWGTQPMIVNYHAFAREARPELMQFIAKLVKERKAHKEYLQYGKMMRAPQLADDHAEEIDIAQMSTYGYKTKGTNLFPHKKVVPMLYSSAWRNKEGNILLTFVNISEEAKELSFTINPEELGLAAEGKMFINSSEVAEWPAKGSAWSTSCRIEGCSTLIYELKNN